MESELEKQGVSRLELLDAKWQQGLQEILGAWGWISSILSTISSHFVVVLSSYLTCCDCIFLTHSKILSKSRKVCFNEDQSLNRGQVLYLEYDISNVFVGFNEI